jgi:outer membrane immunogenic protein
MFRTSLALCAFVSLVLGVGAANANGWGGYYIGLNAGQGASEVDTTRTISGTGYFAVTSPPAIEAASAMLLDEEKTFVGGAQIGVNWPLGEFLLVGLELDAAGFGNDESAGLTVTYPCCAPATFTTTNSLEQTWLATGRLKVGLTFDWVMLYGTGGYAGADMTFTQTFSDTSFPVPLEVIENSEFRSGYSAGGGIEIMIESGASIRVEYLYLDLGEITATGPIAAATGASRTSTGRAEVTDQIVRAGINFQLD